MTSPESNVRLYQCAKEINVRRALAHKRAGKSADDHRVAAGLLLKEARVPLGDEFAEWCTGNIKRSYREVQRLIAAADGQAGRELVAVSDTVTALRSGQLPAEDRARAVVELFGPVKPLVERFGEQICPNAAPLIAGRENNLATLARKAREALTLMHS